MQPVDDTQHDCNNNRHQQSNPYLFFIMNEMLHLCIIPQRVILVIWAKVVHFTKNTEISKGFQTEEMLPSIANCGTGIVRLYGVCTNGDRKSQ